MRGILPRRRQQRLHQPPVVQRRACIGQHLLGLLAYAPGLGQFFEHRADFFRDRSRQVGLVAQRFEPFQRVIVLMLRQQPGGGLELRLRVLL